MRISLDAVGWRELPGVRVSVKQVGFSAGRDSTRLGNALPKLCGVVCAGVSGGSPCAGGKIKKRVVAGCSSPE